MQRREYEISIKLNAGYKSAESTILDVQSALVSTAYRILGNVYAVESLHHRDISLHSFSQLSAAIKKHFSRSVLRLVLEDRVGCDSPCYLL